MNLVDIGYSQLQQRKDELDERISPNLYQLLEGQQPINDHLGGLLFSQGKRNGKGTGDQIKISRESRELVESGKPTGSQLEVWQN